MYLRSGNAELRNTVSELICHAARFPRSGALLLPSHVELPEFVVEVWYCVAVYGIVLDWIGLRNDGGPGIFCKGMCVCVCVCVCVYVCMYIRMYIRMYVYVCVYL